MNWWRLAGNIFFFIWFNYQLYTLAMNQKAIMENQKILEKRITQKRVATNK